jgi:hypothetical protein
METRRPRGKSVNRQREKRLSALPMQTPVKSQLVLFTLEKLPGRECPVNYRGLMSTSVRNDFDNLEARKIQRSTRGLGPSGLTGKGTGPRTKLGKERTKHNALTHGIFSKAVVLGTESRAEFDALLNGLCKDFRPTGRLEDILVEILAVTLWRQRRLLAAEAAETQAGMESIGHQDGPHPGLNALFACRPHYDCGINSKIADPEVRKTCIDLLKNLKLRIEANGFDLQKDKLVMTKIYGNSNQVHRAKELFDNCVTEFTAGRGDERRVTLAEETKREFLNELENEIERVRRYPEEQALQESNRISQINLESCRRSVPDSPRLDQLLKYSAALERTFDRTLSQLERAKRMHLGQPVAPRIDVNVSSS